MPSTFGSDTPLESPKTTSGTFGRLFRRFTRRSTASDDTSNTPASTSTSSIPSSPRSPTASSSTVGTRGEEEGYRSGGSISVSDTIRGLTGLTVKDTGSSRGEGSTAAATSYAASTGVSRFISAGNADASSTSHASSSSYAGASATQNQPARAPTSPTASAPLSSATSYAYAGSSTDASRSMSMEGAGTSGASSLNAYVHSTVHAGTSPLPTSSYMYAGPSTGAAHFMSAKGSNSSRAPISSAHMRSSATPIASRTSYQSMNEGLQTPPSTTYSPFPPVMYLDSQPSSPYAGYTYSQQTTPQPQPYPFYSPAPLSPAPLSPPTLSPDQPTLAGRIQSLLDSINVFSRSEESSPSSTTSSTPTATPNEQLSHPPTANSLMSPRRPRYDTDVLPDTSSIMVYSPLLPTDMDLVELAETVPFAMTPAAPPAPLPPSPPPVVNAPLEQRHEEEEIQVHMQPSSSALGSGWSSWWPFNAFSSWSQPASPNDPVPQIHSPIPAIYTPLPPPSPLPSQNRNGTAFWEHHTPASTARLELLPNSPFGGQTPLPNVYTPLPNEYTPLPPNSPLLSPGPQLVPLDLSDGRGRDEVPQQRIWVPSKTMLSIQAMWWGYRLYIPPPLMRTLSSASISAARRSAILTSALTWFFNNLPISLLPVPLQPLLVLLQSLSPLVALVGGAIAGLWGVVEGYDVGFGIILTATWLMPIALVPSTWTQEEWPVSPPLRTRELQPEGPTSLDAMVARARSTEDATTSRGGLPTPPASTSGLPTPPASSGVGSSHASPLTRPDTISSPRSDAVSPPTSPRSNWSSPPSSPGSVSSGTLTPTMSPGLSVGTFRDTTPMLNAGPLPMSPGEAGGWQVRVEESGNLAVSPGLSRERDRAPASPESGIYIPSPPASPMATRSPYPSAQVPAAAGRYLPPSPSLSHSSPFPATGAGYALPFSYSGDGPATGGVYSGIPNASYGSNGHPAGPGSPLPGAHDAIPPSSPYASPQMMLSPLSMYLYTSPPAHTSPLPLVTSSAPPTSPLPAPSLSGSPLPPHSPSRSTSSYYSAHMPTQGYYSLSPSSPASVYSTADEETPRPRETALPSPPRGHSTPASPASVYSSPEQTPKPRETPLSPSGAGASTPSRARRERRARERRGDVALQTRTGQASSQISPYHSPAPAVDARDTPHTPYGTPSDTQRNVHREEVYAAPTAENAIPIPHNAHLSPYRVSDVMNSQAGYAPSLSSPIPSPLPFSPPVGYGFSAFGVPPSPASTPRSISGNHEDGSGRAAHKGPDPLLEKELLLAPTLGSVPLPEVDVVDVRERRRRRRERRERQR